MRHTEALLEAVRLDIVKPNNYRQGKCVHCKKAYIFKTALHDTDCPHCNGGLKQTSHLLKWEWKPIY